MNPDRSLAQWVALSLVPNLGRRSMTRLIEQFGSLDAVFAADEAALRAVPRIGPKLAAAIRAVDVESTQCALAAWHSAGIGLALHPDAPCAGSVPFPPALAGLTDAPPILFQRGTRLPADDRAVAIIGTRRPTPAARQIAGSLAGFLAAHGWTIVSGLAEGIDTAAHDGALRSGGRTLAVLGCGVRVVYPPGSAELAARIAQRGAILSETHPDANPSSPTLVARNRLISGLARALIVVETGETGGSLHAVRFARDQGRTVIALDLHAAGNRLLIAEGAVALPPDADHWDSLLACLEQAD